jgi:hypothetical protein
MLCSLVPTCIKNTLSNTPRRSFSPNSATLVFRSGQNRPPCFFVLRCDPTPGRPARVPIWRMFARLSARETLRPCSLAIPSEKSPHPRRASYSSKAVALACVPPCAPGARCKENATSPPCPLPPGTRPTSCSRKAARPRLDVPTALRASCARKAPCLSAAWPRPTRRKPVSPPPGGHPSREKPYVRRADSVPLEKNPAPLPPGTRPAHQKPYVPARRCALCSREALRPRRPARVLPYVHAASAHAPFSRKALRLAFSLCFAAFPRRRISEPTPSQRVRVLFVAAGLWQRDGSRWHRCR